MRTQLPPFLYCRCRTWWQKFAPVAIRALAWIIVLVCGQVASCQERPNIVFIAIDDLNDWVGCLDRHPLVKTPNIDRLAEMGTLFTNAHCQAPLCNSSRTSLMTGLRPSTTGVYGLAPWFRDDPSFADHETLPQAFDRVGYEVMMTGKLWHGGYPPRPFREAEADQWGPGAGVGVRPPEKLVDPTPGGNHPLVDWGTFPHSDQDKGDWAVTSWAVERLEETRDQPFFLGVGFFLPHVPCYATQQWFDLYPDDATVLPPILADDRGDIPDFAWYMHWDLPEPRTSWLQANHQLQPLSRAYLASISFVDSQVGRVLEALESSDHSDNTIVVLWSDHGFHLGEKGISGKNSLWERSTRVPLIFSGPSIQANARCQQPAELLDLYPTLLELCGIDRTVNLEGHSLVPQLTDATTERTWPAITTHNQGNHAVRSTRFRLIRYADGSEELYDLLADPNEWVNLTERPEYDQIGSELREWLPAVDVPPMAGSRHRILTFENGQWIWEGEPIQWEQLVD